jgi:hypothetical protein
MSKDIQYPARIAINNDQSIVISDWIQLAVPTISSRGRYMSVEDSNVPC